jgi:two-component system, NarL family, sensor histidine kinase BarA
VTSNVEQSALDEPIRLEDIIEREALGELCESFHALFGLGVRVYSAEGTLLGAAAKELDICGFVNHTPAGRASCGATVSSAKSVDPGETGDVTHPCFTGLAYRIVSLVHEGRRVGRIVIGPFAAAGLREPPPELGVAVPGVDQDQANGLLARVPRVKPEALARIAAHLETTLELIIFASHKTYVTGKLHLLSAKEGYRELEEKTRRLEQALARLKELDRLKSNFLGTVSHELRTPLTSIIGYSEMLAEGIAGPLAPEQAEFVKTIHGKGEQLLALIVGLLDLSKLESGTMPIRQTMTRIEPILDEVVSTITPVAHKKDVTLAFERVGSTCDVRADPERLRQVFVNLVENAVKFTPRGGKVTLRARVLDAAPEDDDDDSGYVLLAPIRRKLEISVSDTGIGIPAAERSKVFDAFYQVDSSRTREFGGTGLGLSIVQRIVEAHGGSVRIEANTPSGTVFIVSLPSAATRRALPSRVPPAPAKP